MDSSASSRRWWIVAASVLGLYGVLAVLVRVAPDNVVDRTILRWVSGWDPPFLDDTMEWFSWFTDLRPRLVLALIAVVGIALVGHYRLAAAIAIAVALTAIPINALDSVGGIIAGRIRPNGAPFLAYPSGHVLGTVVQYGIAIYLAFRIGLRRWLRTLVVAVLAIPIMAVGPSRIFTMAHWPSDVVGAYLLGAASLITLVVLLEFAEQWLAKRGLLRDSKRSQSDPSTTPSR